MIKYDDKYYMLAFLTNTQYKEPTLIFGEDEKVPHNYSEITIVDFITKEIVTPVGINGDGLPYFPDDFYEKRKKEYNRIVKTEGIKALDLFWFYVIFGKN